jgi:hypothetical protein
MPEKFDISLYNDEFFQWHHQPARDYSIKTMDWFIDEYKPESVCHFGCGIGSYLEAAYHKGIRRLKGYDIGGDAASKYIPAEIQSFIEYKDCTKQLRLRPAELDYQCVLSFETAEHIDPKGSWIFVWNICTNLAYNGLVLFTAAPPGQQGCDWMGLFKTFFLQVDDRMTKHIADNWKRIGCPEYISTNLLVFHHKDYPQ